MVVDSTTAPMSSALGSTSRFEVPGRGERIGRFVLDEELGRGGMGVVYAAWDPRLEREVALKVLTRALGSPMQRARVMREAQALARLSDPYVVPIFDVGFDRALDVVWIAMERVRGPTLAQWLSDRPAVPRIVDAFVQAARGLAAAHAAGLVHRDFKPGNAMLTPDGRVVVLDFGLAWAPGVEGGRHTPASRALSETMTHSPGRARDPLAITLTESDAVVGTLPYMAPEQHAHRDVDARADQYALCVSLYEALVGHRPFRDDAGSMIDKKRRGPPPRHPSIPASVWRVIARGLQADPAERFADMDALIQALRRTTTRRARAWAWPGMGAGALAIVLAWSSRADDPCAEAATHVDAIWNGDRAQTITQRLRATGLPMAADTADRVRQRLDRVTLAWKDEAIAACRRDFDRSAPTVRACIDDGLAAMSAAIDVLAQPDATIVARAPRLLEALPDPNDCAPDRAHSATRDETTRHLLERARAWMRVGDHAQAQEIATQALARARERDDAAGIAAAQLLIGGTHLDSGEWDAARADLERARHLAVAEGLDEIAAIAAIKLVHVCTVRYDVACAEPWIRAAEASLDRLGSARSIARGELLLARGDMALRQGQPDLALEHYERALDAAIDERGPEDVMVGVVHSAIGMALAHAGRHEDALAAFARSDAIDQRRFGDHDVGRAGGLENAAGSLYALGRAAESRAKLQQAIVLIDTAYGREHPHAIRLRGNLVLVLADLGELDAAASLATEVVRTKRRLFGDDDVQVAMAEYNAALVASRQNALAAAGHGFAEALRIWEHALGPDHVDLALPLTGLAEIALEQERPADALVAIERALQLHARSSRPVQPELDFALARAQWTMGDRDAALAAAERARAALPETRSPLAGRLDRDTVDTWLRDHPP